MELSGVQQRGVWQANAGNATLSAYVVAEHRLVCCCVTTNTKYENRCLNSQDLQTYTVNAKSHRR